MLDVGCGTGTLALRILDGSPGARVVGLDRDPEMLGRARRKFEGDGSGIRWVQGHAAALPHPDEHFDAVLSSLVLHHLRPVEKARAAGEIRRVLRPGGRAVVADWGRPGNRAMRVAYFLAVQLLDGFETTADHVRGVVPRLLRAKGLEDVSQSAQFSTVAGTLRIWRARKPGS